MTLLPWHQALWARLQRVRTHLPHALLLAGPGGLGEAQFARTLAAALLCDHPQAHGLACGQCVACQWIEAGTHPDLLMLSPGAGEEEGDTGKASSQIVIEQVRSLQEKLGVTAHRANGRVIIIEPAEAMNAFTANALLKLLEEPPAGCIFLLLSARPRLLLPTLLSRCQRWDFPHPEHAQVLAWLASEGIAEADALLAVCGNMPLATLELARNGGAALLQRFINDILTLPDGDVLQLAGRWEDWTRARAAQPAELELAVLVMWMQRWVSDLASQRLGGRIRFFPAQNQALGTLAARSSNAHVVSCYNEMSQIRRVVHHPLNARLVLEDMLMRYNQAFAGVHG